MTEMNQTSIDSSISIFRNLIADCFFNSGRTCIIEQLPVCVALPEFSLKKVYVKTMHTIRVVIFCV